MQTTFANSNLCFCHVFLLHIRPVGLELTNKYEKKSLKVTALLAQLRIVCVSSWKSPKIPVTFGMQHKSEHNFRFHTSLQGQQTENFCLLDIFIRQHDIIKCGSLWGCVYMCVLCAYVHFRILLPFSHNVCLLAMISKKCWVKYLFAIKYANAHRRCRPQR